MIQDIGNRAYDNQYRNAEPGSRDYVIAFAKAERGPDLILAAETEGEIQFPRFEEVKVAAEDLIYMFSIDDEAFFLVAPGCSIEAPEKYEYTSNRLLRASGPDYLCFAGMTACHLNTWYKDNQYCGRCGAKAHHDSKERMMRCPECGNLIFPKICPAVSVGVKYTDPEKGEMFLVTRYAGRPYAGPALVAGFVEIGESAEACVVREVKEEVGLDVGNVRYYTSQPWGFAGNLQIGYLCDVIGSPEITLDRNELAIAEFVTRDELEPMGNLSSITTTMIEEFRQGRI